MNEIVDMRSIAIDRGIRKNVLNIERFTLRRSELLAVVGPNGAGKSTLLQVINLLHPYRGELRLFGQDAGCADKTMLRRRSAMVFQETLLLHDTVFDNVAWALRFRGLPASDIRQRVHKALTDFRCDHLAARPAHLLSGGEAQRVCIARALVTDPELLLLDEPFTSLDATTRGEMIEEIRQLAVMRGITVILVSHNFAEVLHFAERALAVFGGSIVQDDKPEMLLRRPVNEQVARLVGMDNIIPCRVEQDGQGRFIRLANGIRFFYPGEVIEPASACCLPGDALYLCDENLTLQPGPWVIIEGLVERVLPDVGTYRVLARLGDQTLSVRVSRHHLPGGIHSQAKIKLAFDPAEAHII